MDGQIHLMIDNREIASIAEGIKNRSLRLDLHEIEIEFAEGSFEQVSLNIVVEVKRDEFVSRWTVLQGAALSERVRERLSLQGFRPAIVTSADRYRVRARTISGTAVILDGVSPIPSSSTSLTGGEIYSIEFGRLDFLPNELEGLDSEGLRQRIQNAHGGAESTADSIERSTPPFEQLFAYVHGVDLIPSSHGITTVNDHPFLGEIRSFNFNCFVGDVHGGRFCLEKCDGDLRIYFRRSIDDSHQLNARQVFDGIMFATGLLHGCHPWPYYFEHRCDLRLVERWATVSLNCQRSPLKPLPAGAMRRSPAVNELFRTTAEFMSHSNDDTAFFSRAMWLMREANTLDMAFEIRLVALCSLLEGMIHRLESRLLNQEERNLTRQSKWMLIIERMHLLWTGAFEPVLNSWMYYRAPLAHGFIQHSDEGAETPIVAFFRISAGIYVLMAREMGFRGIMNLFWGQLVDREG